MLRLPVDFQSGWWSSLVLDLFAGFRVRSGLYTVRIYWGLGFGPLGFRVKDLGIRVQGLGFVGVTVRVYWGLGLEV